MADIRITPASSVMSFTSSLNYIEKITQDASGSLNLYGSGSTGRTEILSIDGNNGRLFTVSDDLSDSLFSVNTIAGLPVIEAFADNTVKMGQYGQNVLVVTGSKVGIGISAPQATLDVSASIRSTGYYGGKFEFYSTYGSTVYSEISPTFDTGDGAQLNFFVKQNGNPPILRMRIRENGNVFIGASAATNDRLEVQGTLGLQASALGSAATQILVTSADPSSTTRTVQTRTPAELRDDMGAGVGSVTSVGGTGTVSGLSLSGTVTSTGNLTLGGTLSLTAANVNAVGTITNNTSGNAATATTAVSVITTPNNSTNETTYITFVDGTTGAQEIETDISLTYNPSTNILTAGTFSGALSGTATNATNTTVTTSGYAANFKIPFANTTVSTTGNYGLLQDSEAVFTYNPSTNTFTSPLINATTAYRGGDGSAIAPAFSFSGDTNNGMYRITTDTLGFSTGGNARMRIDSSGNVGIGEPTIQGRFHVFQTTNLGGTAGNSLILQSLQNTGGSGGNNVYIKDYAVRDATGTTWTTWRHHNSIDIDGSHNTPGTNTKTWWERDPNAGIHYFGNSATIALTVNGTTNTIIANNIEVEANTTGIYSDGGDLAVGDFNGNDFGTTFYGPGGNNLINLSTNFTQFYYPIYYTSPGGSEVNGEVAYWGGGSVAAGDLYYYNSSGNWAQVDADAAATATGMLGIARATGTASTVGMLLRGRARFNTNSNYTGLTTVGAILYASTSPGAFSQTAPSGTGDIVRIIGYVQSTASDEIYFCPDNTWVELA